MSTKREIEIAYRSLINARTIESYPYDKVLDSCKYVRLARDYHYDNYRLILVKDLKNMGIWDSLSKYQKAFFSKAGASVGMYNFMNGNLISIVFRSTMEKDFMNYSLFYSIYGFDMIDPNFKYGDWLVITEGLYDADVLRQIYPNVVATQTSNVTVIQAEVLKKMTNNFIIAFDSDKAGESGLSKAIKRLGTDIQHLPVYPGDKDIGQMEEIKYKNEDEYRKRYVYYKETLDDCMLGGYGFLI